MVECTSTDLGGKDCILLFDMRNLGSRPIDEYLSPYRRISLTLCSDIKLEDNFDSSLVIKIISKLVFYKQRQYYLNFRDRRGPSPSL